MLANKQEGKPVAAYVLKMKGYVEQLERLGYVLPQDLTVGLILNGLTSDFARFVRNYNMHNMEKTVGELHAMLIGYEKGLPKKAETPQVMMIKGGKIQKSNKKSLKAKGKGSVSLLLLIFITTASLYFYCSNSFFLLRPLFDDYKKGKKITGLLVCSLFMCGGMFKEVLSQGEALKIVSFMVIVL
ncbi:hypothetical protein Tco_0934707 [Tanacetum coccineum]